MPMLLSSQDTKHTQLSNKALTSALRALTSNEPHAQDICCFKQAGMLLIALDASLQQKPLNFALLGG